jgi:hypothetical protein
MTEEKKTVVETPVDAAPVVSQAIPAMVYATTVVAPVAVVVAKTGPGTVATTAIAPVGEKK